MTVASDLERRMLDIINEERTSRGLSTLTLELNLNAAAEAHSEWMLAADTFSHSGVNGSSALDRMRLAGFDFSGRYGYAENLAIQTVRGSDSYVDDMRGLHQTLMNSPSHRATLLRDELTHIGIGIEVGQFRFSSGTYQAIVVTQTFAFTAGAVDEDLPNAPPPPPPRPLEPVEPVLPGLHLIGDTPVAAHDAIAGRDRDDTIEGLAGADTLTGNGGRDSLIGGTGDDTLYGGDGSDWLLGNTSLDTLYGGAGNDWISAGDGVDRAWGGDGNDEILGRSGTDTLYGQNGEDVIEGNFGDDLIYGGADADALYGGSAWDTLYGGTGDDTLYGMMGSDALFGDAGADLLVGGSGDDTLSGNGGNDTLYGNQGVDRLTGGGGDDVLRGGTLADTFVFTDGGGRDRIEDFERGQDLLLLDAGLWTGTLTAAQVVQTFASVTADGVLFDFGADEILLEGLRSFRVEDLAIG